MKIVFVSTFYPYRGGIAQFNALLYRAFEKDHEVKAITFKRQYPSLLFPGKTQYVTETDAADPIPAERWLDAINPFSYVTTARAVKRHKPNLVITKYWMTFFGPSLGFVLGRQSRFTKRIAILDNVIPHERRFFDNFFNRYFLRRNDGFIAMTEKVKLDLLSYLPDAKCTVIPHPVYNQFGTKLPRSEALRRLGLAHLEDQKILLFFGIIRDYKGLDLLIDTLSGLKEDFHLIIAGEAYGSFSPFEQQIKNLALESRCHVFQRYISDGEVPCFFSAADVCMLTYKSATQSGITGIAQHFEVPMIATNVGGLAETIKHEKSGFICDERSALALVEWVNKYFNEGWKDPMSQHIAAENHSNSWEEFSRKALEFVEEL
ncbi:MAG: glycosyltransferase [Bacteroidetes bacterium]|nr:glycosyltransferase [Bacteroidota bacterium]MBM3423940.1 glycosyltransferase [Bacteroidota bacterium]